MAQKDVGNKVPIYKLKTTKQVMEYYDEWGKKDKYNKDMVEWNYTGPKETVDTFRRYATDKDILIFDAGSTEALNRKFVNTPLKLAGTGSVSDPVNDKDVISAQLVLSAI